MSKQTTRSTKKSLGLISDREIDLWSNDAKRRPKGMERNGAKAPNRKNQSIDNEQDFSIVFDTSLNQLREKTRTERSNSSTLSNRMKYLEVDMKRKKQMVEIAKSKYQKMIEVRNKSFIQKKQLQKERQNLSRRHQMSVTLQATRIKVERKNSTISGQIWKDKNQEAANYVKDKRFLNERLIAERQQLEIEKKKRLVERQQQLSDISREKLRQLSNEKIVQGKQQHSKKLLQEYAKGEIQRRKNINLMGVFKQKIQKISEETLKYKKDLEAYEKMLGMRFKGASGNRHSHSSNSQFYITN